jgi:hypothetical protein
MDRQRPRFVARALGPNCPPRRETPGLRRRAPGPRDCHFVEYFDKFRLAVGSRLFQDSLHMRLCRRLSNIQLAGGMIDAPSESSSERTRISAAVKEKSLEKTFTRSEMPVWQSMMSICLL